MYALRFIKLRNCSRHQKKHLQQQNIAFENALSYFLAFFSMNSIITLIKLQIAIIKEPNATVPKWYLEKKNQINKISKNTKFVERVNRIIITSKTKPFI